MTGEYGGYSPPDRAGAPQLARVESAIWEVSAVRHSEMKSISERLGRIGRFPWAKAWSTAATLSGGAVVGGLLALIPFLSTTPAPTPTWKHIYIAALIIGAALTLILLAAAITTHAERAESIADIKADYDKYILETFIEPSVDTDNAVTTTPVV